MLIAVAFILYSKRQSRGRQRIWFLETILVKGLFWTVYESEGQYCIVCTTPVHSTCWHASWGKCVQADGENVSTSKGRLYLPSAEVRLYQVQVGDPSSDARTLFVPRSAVCQVKSYILEVTKLSKTRHGWASGMLQTLNRGQSLQFAKYMVNEARAK